MKADYHVHTEFSDDSSYDMEDVVKDAIDMDIKELCFTDHVDYGIKDDWDKPESMKQRPGAVSYTHLYLKVCRGPQRSSRPRMCTEDKSDRFDQVAGTKRAFTGSRPQR